MAVVMLPGLPQCFCIHDPQPRDIACGQAWLGDSISLHAVSRGYPVESAPVAPDLLSTCADLHVHVKPLP